MRHLWARRFETPPPISAADTLAQLSSPSPATTLTAIEETSTLFKSSPLPPETPALLRRLSKLAALGAEPTTTPAEVDSALAACGALAVSPTTSAQTYAPLRRRVLPTLTVLALAPDMRVRSAAATALSALLRAPPMRVAIWAPVSTAALMHHRAPSAETQRELLAALAALVHCVAVQSCHASTEPARCSAAIRHEIAESELEALAEVRAEEESGRSVKAMPTRRVPGHRRRRGLLRSRGSTLLMEGDAPSLAATRSQAEGKHFSGEIRIALAALARLLDAAPDANPPALALERLLAVEDCARRARAAQVDVTEYRGVIISEFVASAPVLAAVVVRVLWWEGTAGALEQRQHCKLDTAHSCLSVLRTLLAEAPGVVCHPRAPLLVGLTERAEKLAECAASAATETEGRATGTEAPTALLEGIFSTMRALAAACASDAAADVQVEIVTERCLRNLCNVLSLVLRPALRMRSAQATDWAALQTLEAWSQLARGNLSGAVWEGGPAYVSAIPIFAQMVRYISYLKLLRANGPETKEVRGKASVYTDRGLRSLAHADASSLRRLRTQPGTFQLRTFALPNRYGNLPTSKTFSPARHFDEGANTPLGAESDHQMALDDGDVDVEIEEAVSDSDDEVDENEGTQFHSMTNPQFERKSYSSIRERRQRELSDCWYQADEEPVPTPLHCGVEIQDTDLLERALQEAAQVLVSQSSSVAVIRDTFRALMRLYTSDIHTSKQSPTHVSEAVVEQENTVPSSPSRWGLDAYGFELLRVGSFFRHLSPKEGHEDLRKDIRASLQVFMRCVDGQGTDSQVGALLAETRSPFLANLLQEEASAECSTMQADLQTSEAELVRVKAEVLLLRGQVDEMRSVLKSDKRFQPDPKQESRLSSRGRFSSYRHLQSWLKS